LSTLTAEQLVALLARYVAETGAAIDLLLVGALALHAYGVSDRATRDIDGELQGPVGPLLEFLTAQNIPADLTQNFSGWSVVAMPPGYRDRATDLVRQERLRIRLLVPVDFVIAKLRRGTELDHDDASLVAAHFHLTRNDVRAAADAALAASPQDTSLFLFQKTVDLFCKNLPS
jgi:Nucleotidyltransferase of unknown function (DUF6036)